MKESVVVLLAFLTIVGCGNRNGNNTNVQETLESNKSSYPDIVNFIAKEYQCGWEGMDFFEKGNLSMAYLSCSTDYGYAKLDINGDGVIIESTCESPPVFRTGTERRISFR